MVAGLVERVWAEEPQASRWLIEREEWPEKPSVIELTRLDPLPAVYKRYRNTQAKVKIYYPGGLLVGGGLMNWLIGW